MYHPPDSQDGTFGCRFHILTHDLRFGNWYLEHGKPVRPQAQGAPVRARSGWFDRLLGRG